MATTPAMPTIVRSTDPIDLMADQVANEDPIETLAAQVLRENPQETAARATRFGQEQRAVGEMARSTTGMLSPERFRQIVPESPQERAEIDKGMAAYRATLPFMAQVGGELVAGGGDVVRDTARSLQMVGGMVNPKIGQAAQQAGAKIAQDADFYSRTAPTPEGAGMARTIALGAARSVPGLVAQTLAAQGAGMMFQQAPKLAGFAAFAGTAAAPVVGQTYQEAKTAWLERGADDQTAEEFARTEALVAGGITALTNKIPFDKMMIRTPAAQEALRSSVSRAIRRFGAGAVAEGTQEVLEQVGQDLAQYTLRQDDAAFGTEGVSGYLSKTVLPTFGSAALAGGVVKSMHGGSFDADPQYTGPDGITRTITPEQQRQLDQRAAMNEQSRVEREGMGLEPSRPEDVAKRSAFGVGPSAAGTTTENAPLTPQPQPKALNDLTNEELGRLSEMNGLKPTKNRVTMIGRLQEIGADPADLGPPAFQTAAATGPTLQPVESGAPGVSSTTVEIGGGEFNQTAQNEKSVSFEQSKGNEPAGSFPSRAPQGPTIDEPNRTAPETTDGGNEQNAERVTFRPARMGREAMSPQEQEAVRLVSSLTQTPVRFVGPEGEDLGGARGLYQPGDEGRPARIYLADTARANDARLPDEARFTEEITRRVEDDGEMARRAWAIEQERRRAVKADPMTATALHEVTHAIAEEQPYLIEQVAETLAPEVQAAAEGYILDLRRHAGEWVRRARAATPGSAEQTRAATNARAMFTEAARLTEQHRAMSDEGRGFASDLTQEGVARLMEARSDGRGVASLYRAATNQGILHRMVRRLLDLLSKVGLADRINANLRKALSTAAKYMELKRAGDAKMGVSERADRRGDTAEGARGGRMSPAGPDDRVVHLSGQELGGDVGREDARERFTELMDRTLKGKLVKNESLGAPILVTARSIKHTANQNRRPLAFRVLAGMEQLLANAMVTEAVTGDTGKQRNLTAVLRMEVTAELDGKTYPVELIVKRFDQREQPVMELEELHVLYHGKVDLENKDSSPTDRLRPTGEPGGEGPSFGEPSDRSVPPQEGGAKMAPAGPQGGTPGPEPTADELAAMEAAVKTAVSERAQGRVVGRPELANPGLSEEARGLVDAADQLRKEAKEPIARSQAEAFARGSAMLTQDYAGTRRMVIEKARTGQVLTDAETAAAKAITDSEGWEAVTSGDAAKLWRAMQFAEAYRATGTEAARSLAIRRDNLKSLEDRMRAKITEAMLYPDNFAVAVMRRLRAARESIVELPETTQEQRTEKTEKLDAVDRKIRDQARRVAKKRAEVIQKLRGMGINLSELTDAQLRDPVYVARITKMASIAGAGWSDRMYEFWINAILSGLRTHVVNIAGTNAYGAWEVWAQRAIQAAVGKANGDKNAPLFGEYAAMVAAIPATAAQTARRALRAFKAGVPLFEDEVTGTLGESLAKIEQGRGAKIGGVAGEMIRIPTRALAVEDDFAKSWIGTLEAHAYAYRLATQKGLKGRERWAWITEHVNAMDPEVWGHAVEYAKEKTFNNEAGGLAKIARQIRTKTPGGAFVLPFINTPQNLFMRAFEKTPFGVLVKGAKALAVHTGAINWHPSTVGWTYDRSEATKDIANGIFAAALTALLWGWTEPEEDGLPTITGSRTPSQGGGPDTAGLANRTAPPMSIKIGGTWYSYGRLDPFSTMLATVVDGVNAAKTIGKGGDPVAPLAGTITSVKQSVMDRTFLQGIGDFVRAVDDVGPNPKALVRWGQNFAVSWVPNIVRATARATDENIRSTRIAADPGAPFWNEALLRLRQGALPTPLAGNVPPPRYDLWGRELKDAPTGAPSTDFLYRLLSPVQARQVPDDPAKKLDLVLTRWNQANPDTLKAPRAPQEYITREVNGKSTARYMSDEDYAAFVRDSGREAVKLLSRVKLNTEKPTLRDVQLIEDGIRAAREQVMAKMKLEQKLFPELYKKAGK